MSTYVEKLWGSTTATYPTTVLTKRWTTTNETAVQCIADTAGEGGYIFEQEWSANARRLNSLDAIDGDANRDDIELLCRFRLEGTTRVDNEFGLVGRGAGSGGSETGYECYLQESTTNDLFLRVVRINGGSALVLVDTSTILFDVGSEWLWMRFRINGSSIRGRLWRDTEEEPTVWHADETDTVVTAAGWGGLWAYQSGQRTDVDYLSIGTNGDTAPLTASTTTTLRGTTVNAQVLAQPTNTTVRASTVNAQILQQPISAEARVSTVNAQVLWQIIQQDVRATQQVAELAVQQNLANVETRSTQQIVEVLGVPPVPHLVTQQTAEVAVQQDLANVEVRSTQQVIETLFKTDALRVFLTKQTAEVAVQKTTGVFIRNTQQVIEVLLSPPVNEPAYDNFEAQTISVMV